MTLAATDVVIGPARATDIPAVAALWCEAFPGRRSVADRIRMLETGGVYGGLETVLVGRTRNGDLVAACKIYRLTQRITGVAVPMMGLAAVAVTPEARRRGLGARLCEAAMEAARDRGDVVSVLYPFRADYYERLGWGLVGELHEYRFSTGSLAEHDGARHVRPARLEADSDAVRACYARVAARSHGPLERDARIWGWRLAGAEVGVWALEPDVGMGARGVVVYDRGGVSGYALLRRGPGRVDVRELVAETDDAYAGLLAYLASRARRWPKARHTARPEERFGDRLTDPRPPGAGRVRSLHFPTARIVRGPMLRVLDVAAALSARRYFDADPGPGDRGSTLDILLADRQMPSNSGAWRLVVDRGVGRAGHAGTGGADARLETDAATFARIFAGELAPSDAGRLGRARIAGDAPLMDATFATREGFWLPDEF